MHILTRPVVIISLCAATLVQTAFASSPPIFAAPKLFSTTAPAANMVMGDFDGDGIPDVAMYGVVYDANFHGSGSVEVLFGNGTGGFKTASASFTLVNDDSSYRGIAAADLDGDGKSELIIAGGNAVLIYDWNGASFSQTRSISLISTRIDATTVAVGDITGKGHQDIVTCDDFGTIGIVLISNDGKGDYGSPVAFPAGGAAFYAKPIVADVNGDGFADVVLAASDPGTNNTVVGVLLNQGNGTLGQEVAYSAPALFGGTNSFVSATTATVADVDGDGKPDLICACVSKDKTTFKATYFLTVNLGVGDGTFKEGIAFQFDDSQKTYGINAIDTADINGDGRADIVTADYADSGFTVTEWSGSGDTLAMASQEHFPAFSASFNSIALGYKASNGAFVTFNKDTNIDVLLGTTSIFSGKTYQAAVYKNTSGAPGVNTLPPTTIKITGTIAPGGDIHFVVNQTSTATGLTVRIQYSTTPTVESSWTDLPGGGYLTKSGAGTYSFGSAGTSSYPIGSGIYFRAIAAAQGFTDSISTKPLGPFTLKLAQLTINVKETSTSDPTGQLHIVHIGDKLNYVFTWTNIGNAPAHNLVVMTPVPTYIDASSDLHVQFPKTALIYNQFGHYTNISGQTYVWWNVADLSPGFSQSVTLTVQTGPQMRLQQQIGLGNNYDVYSTKGLPQAVATGATSGAPNVGDDVLGPFSLSITPDVTSVAPGGLINYTIRITNFSASSISNVVIADPVPEFANFVSASFLNAKGAVVASPAHSIKVNGKATAINNPLRLIGLLPSNSLPVAEQEFLAANPLITMPGDNADEVVFYVGTLAKDASVSVHLTVQADFQLAGNFTDQEVKNFDYTAFFTDSADQVEQSKNEGGNIFTPVAGPLINAPFLTLQKGVTAAKLSPGSTFAVAFLAHNSGLSAANDVFIQDSLPTGADGAVNPVLVSGLVDPVVLDTTSTAQLNSGITFIGGGSSITTSKANYFVTFDPDNLITVHGLHLEPGANVEVTYFMQVPTNTPVPEQLFAGASFIGAGNGNLTTNGTGTNIVTNTVPSGTPIEIPMAVEGNVSLFTPATPFEAVKHPLVASNPSATVAQLDAAYKKSPNNMTVTAGVQRYIMHYQNVGNDTASDAHLLFSIPANTEFYRASFMSGGNVVKPGPKQSITEPAKLGSGNVIFNIGALKTGTGSGGYCLVEVVLLPTGINPLNPRIFASAPQIYNGVQPKAMPRKLDDSASSGSVVYDGQNVPSVGVLKVVPQAVHQGETFSVQLVVFNYGDVNQNGFETIMQAPAGAQIVGAYDQTGRTLPFTAASIDTTESVNPRHSAFALTVLLRATGTVGTSIVDNTITIKVPYHGTNNPSPAAIHIVAANQVVPNTTITTVTGAQFITLGEMAVIPLGQSQPGVGNALVSGPSSQFGNIQEDLIIADSGSGGTTIAVGPASDIPLVGLADIGASDTKSLLKQLATTVGKHGGNIFNGPEDNLLGEDGKTLIDNDTGEVATTLQQLVKANVRPVIASGAVALPATATQGPVLVATGLVSQLGGGSLITFGGGVIATDGAGVISNDGGSIISQDGNGLVSHDGGTVISNDGGSLIGNAGGTAISSGQSAAICQTAGGSIVAAGGGNIVAQGGGNIVAQGGGN